MTQHVTYTSVACSRRAALLMCCCRLHNETNKSTCSLSATPILFTV